MSAKKQTKEEAILDGQNAPRPGQDEGLQVSAQDPIAAKILELHEGIFLKLKRSVGDALLIGELLEKKKREVKHGNFQNWIRDNLPGFTDRTARNYQRLYEHRHEIQERLGEMAGISDAYKLLSAPDQAEPDPESPSFLLREFRANGKRSLNKAQREVLRQYLETAIDRLANKRKELRAICDDLI